MGQSDFESETAPYFNYNPAEAKKLLEAAGSTGAQFKLLYANNYGGPDYVKTSEAVANMLNAVGATVTPVEVDYQKDFIGAGKGIRYGNYDKNSVVMANLGPFNDIDQVMFTYWHSKGSGPARLHDNNVDVAIAKARTLTNDDERLKAYMDLQKYLASKVYAASGIPIAYQYVMVQPWVQNYQLSYTYGYAAESFTKLWLQK
jgi:ABC-type transport system substrate-binding protein